MPDWAVSRPIQEGWDAPDQEGGPAEVRELPENEGEAQGKAGKLSEGVQAADEGLPELKGNSESCGRQTRRRGLSRGPRQSGPGPSWEEEELAA